MSQAIMLSKASYWPEFIGLVKREGKQNLVRRRFKAAFP